VVFIIYIFHSRADVLDRQSDSPAFAAEMMRRQLEEERKRELWEILVAPFTWKAFLMETAIIGMLMS
jgi:hypothetical protein